MATSFLLPQLLKSNKLPKNHSKPINNLAIIGENFQLETPISTKVYSKSSTGKSLTIAEKIKTPPNKIEQIIAINFIWQGYKKKDRDKFSGFIELSYSYF